jgi:uncharacterized protein DUF4124
MRHVAAIALIMSLPLSAAMADVYRSVDAQGHVQYSDTPTPGAELIHVQGQNVTGGTTAPSSTPATTPASTTPPPTQTLAKSNNQIQDQINHDAAQRAVQQDVAQTRADQCKKATDDYDQSIQARRIYRSGADGEREYLTDAEADQMRMNLRLAMQNACGSSQ